MLSFSISASLLVWGREVGALHHRVRGNCADLVATATASPDITVCEDIAAKWGECTTGFPYLHPRIRSFYSLFYKKCGFTYIFMVLLYSFVHSFLLSLFTQTKKESYINKPYPNHFLPLRIRQLNSNIIYEWNYTNNLYTHSKRLEYSNIIRKKESYITHLDSKLTVYMHMQPSFT